MEELKQLSRWQEVQRIAIIEALKANGYNKLKTALFLGIGRQTLYSKMSELYIDHKKNVQENLSAPIVKNSFKSFVGPSEESSFERLISQIYYKDKAQINC